MTIELKGHLDTSKVADVKKLIDEKIAQIDPKETLTFDFNELDYISSSGLRIMLATMKAHPQMEIINASSDVYDVFDTTGFTRILNIKKSLRKIDLSGCKLIGEGGNGAVYRINAEEIVKISKFSQGSEALIHESEQVKEAFLMGVPTVISFDTVDVGNGHKGIVMEALDSDSVGQYICEDSSRMDDIVPKYVDLFTQTHTVRTDSKLFRNTKEWLRSHLDMPKRIINDEEKALFSSILDEIPDTDNFVHFDGHLGNVLMYGDKDDRNLMLIDLGDAGVGHPVLEIAGWAFMMLEPEYAIGCTESERITGMNRELMHAFCRRVLSEMFHVTDETELDKLMYEASLVGRVKSAFVAQRWYSILTNDKFKGFMKRLVEETVTLVPEIRAAIRHFVKLIDEQNQAG